MNLGSYPIILLTLTRPLLDLLTRRLANSETVKRFEMFPSLHILHICTHTHISIHKNRVGVYIGRMGARVHERDVSGSRTGAHGAPLL